MDTPSTTVGADETPGLGSWLIAGATVLVIVLLIWRSREVVDQQPFTPLSWQDIAPDPAAVMRDWQYVVIHHTGAEVGDAVGIDRDHLNRGWEGLGYHFIIGNGQPMPEGSIEWSFRWQHQRHGAHVGAGEYNQHSIGISLVGNFDLEPPSPLQYQRAVDLTATLLERFTQLDVSQVIGHGEATGTNTRCPGVHLDMELFRQEVKRRLAERSAALHQDSPSLPAASD